MTYHIGFIKGTGKVPFMGNGHRKSTVIVQARKDVDCLSPQLWKYMGERNITKVQLKRDKSRLLKAINESYGTDFDTIIID